MLAPAPHPAETQRLLELHQLCLLDTAPEHRFDRVTRLARRLFDVDFAIVSLVDAERQWFKSKQGLAVSETGRDVSFCGHAILQEQVLAVEDALRDPRFADNPLVTGAPHIRFYAGVPVKGPAGHPVGTLCVIGIRPRRFSAASSSANWSRPSWARPRWPARAGPRCSARPGWARSSTTSTTASSPPTRTARSP